MHLVRDFVMGNYIRFIKNDNSLLNVLILIINIHCISHLVKNLKSSTSFTRISIKLFILDIKLYTVLLI